ncbi:2-hydroxyisoflavanone dehydratase-like [Corylus avellana]|uniref:2-hydroxyisoflavanone dehydratase-like n=1 Tax=Corylus avellana TaxID=13451 RepID=UPI001E20C0BE|nr:2-hydroxyisoflavanone dehydratase-like [Corylus avellana]
MDSSTNETTHEFPPYFKVYKDGRVERYGVPDCFPTGLDPKTHVQSRDVVVSSESGVSARLFLPKINGPDHKLPLVVHYHGGAFCVGSPFNKTFHNFLLSLASAARAVVISVDYRLAPEHPLPTAHHDSWAALQWIATHSKGQGPDPWLNEHADFGRVFLAGESAGANIAHYVAVQAGASGLAGPNILGLLMVHPFFGGKESSKMYGVMYPTSAGLSDPIMYPEVDPKLPSMAGGKVLVCVAEKDSLRDIGLGYSEVLRKSGWGGTLCSYETEGEGHGFFLLNPRSHKVEPLIQAMVDFINLD